MSPSGKSARQGQSIAQLLERSLRMRRECAALRPQWRALNERIEDWINHWRGHGPVETNDKVQPSRHFPGCDSPRN